MRPSDAQKTTIGGMKGVGRDGTGRDVKGRTFGHVGQPGQELVQFLLTVGQLAAAAVVDAEAVHDAVDDEEAEGVAGEGEGEGVEELELVLGCLKGRGRC